LDLRFGDYNVFAIYPNFIIMPRGIIVGVVLIGYDAYFRGLGRFMNPNNSVAVSLVRKPN